MRLVLFTLLAACHGGSSALTPGEMAGDPVTLTRSCAGLPTDPFQLENVMTIVPDRILQVSVTYGDGCATHEFAACWDGSISKTSPSTISLDLRHQAHDDLCEVIITRDLFIDISDTPETFGGPQRIDDASIRLVDQR